MRPYTELLPLLLSLGLAAALWLTGDRKSSLRRALASGCLTYALLLGLVAWRWTTQPSVGDTARNFAPFTLLVPAMLMTVLVYLIGRAKKFCL